MQSTMNILSSSRPRDYWRITFTKLIRKTKLVYFLIKYVDISGFHLIHSYLVIKVLFHKVVAALYKSFLETLEMAVTATLLRHS